MDKYQIYYVGSQAEVAHHAAPLERLTTVRIVDPIDVVKLAKPNDMAIFFSEHFPRFREAWLQLNTMGCNTLYAIDGILEWRNAWENRHDEPACPWTMRPVLSDKVACIGRSQVRTLNSWGNQHKTELVGLPRLDSLIATEKSHRINGTNGTRSFRVLVTTAKWPGFTPEQTQKITESLIDLKTWFQQNPVCNHRKIEVIWRLTGDLEKQVNVENSLTDVSGKEMAELLSEVDAIITTPSTVILEGALADLPVCLLDYTNSPRYVDSAWSITAASQIDEVMPQLVSPSSRRMVLQRSFLSETLQHQNPAAERMLDLIQAMTRFGHDCRQAGGPVKFPANMLAAIEGCDPAIDLSVVYPNRPELVAGGRADECNAVASESFRKIEQLEERIELLEYELTKAAEGFEKIASHPVLAPLVKVRNLASRLGGHVTRVIAGHSHEPGG